MNEFNKNTKYSFDDIYNYLTGKMNPLEMHTLEKAALDDDFLAEAIDGYSNLYTIEKNEGIQNANLALQEINQKLPQSTSSKLPSNTNQWRNIAAAILFICISALSYFIIKKESHKNIDTIAQVKTKEEIQNINTIDPIVKEEKQSKTESKPTSVEKSNKDFKPIEKITSIKNNEKQNFDKSENAEPILKEPKLTTTEVEKKGIFENLEDQKLQRKEISVATPEKDISAVKPSSNVAANAATMASAVQPVLGKAKKIDQISEKVEANTKKLDDKKNLKYNPSSVVVLQNNYAVPKIGWDKYKIFILNKIKNWNYENDKQVFGEVILSFNISTKKQPINFVFEKQNNDDFNAAIEAVILNGPKWKLVPNSSNLGFVKLKIIL